MLIRRRVLALASAVLLVGASPLIAQSKEEGRAGADTDREQSRKLSKEEGKEFQAISALLASGRTPANDLSLAWAGNDLLKAQGSKEYVPFTVTIDPSTATSKTLSLYWRVVSKTAPVADTDKDTRDRKDKAPSPHYAYENLHTITVPAGQTEPLRISRSFVVGAGDYDVYVVVKEPDPKKKSDPPAKVGIVRQTVSVPDLWNGELTTSSIIVAERIDPLPAPLTQAQLEERPYALGNMEIVPAKSTRFSKKNDLSVFLLVYNARTNETNAPDCTVEYNFYTLQSGGEKFFNRTNPQPLNAQTLPAGFDPAAGITNGQTVPLASFPEGDYRLEIKITDKLANRSITRDVKFSVSGS
jgi:hypothetical protein